MCLMCHLSFVIFAFTLSLQQFVPCLWVEILRDRKFSIFENFCMVLSDLDVDMGHDKRGNPFHHAPCVSPVGAFSFPQLAVYTLKNLSAKAHAQYRGV